MAKAKTIKIDKKVPIPPPSLGGKNAKYPWRTLEIGDSFYIDCKQSTVCAMASMAGQRMERRFTTRKEGTGTRVWRVE